MGYVIGVDLGGTKIACGLVDRKTGKVIKKIKIQTEAEKGVNGVINNLISSIEEIAIKKVDIGLGIAGQQDIKKGIIVYSPNLPGWKNVNIRGILFKEINKRLGWNNIKIAIDNDANCFTLAESLFGVARKFNYVVGLTLGTGIGSGIVIKNELYHGQTFASEAGHMVIEFQGRLCSCGERGHLEAYASGSAVEKRYKELTGRNKIATDIEKEAISNSKSIGFKVYKEASEYLGVGLANLVNILDPEIIVIGGGLARAQWFLKKATDLMEKMIFFKKKSKVVVKKSKLDDNAGIVGAALLIK